ncbi:MAG: hypothetical protein EBT06_12065 [Gammaproteobacteria bacterium]|nr:hypothetical protein [Gammaproteobacteria bacterium]NBT45622.1 hypothetical protein [Gammaproteobacteria bacterium]NBY22808.1 hypothetical protein [Gammaproteobacteria bacterium]NDE35545.1 hypothetical protein [Gammaproteobacteria bacterium]NDE57524.1 hypothetical protein [Gammaproteobacteria bacterium]
MNHLKKAFIFVLLAGVTLGFLEYQKKPVIDAVAAATQASLQPTFNGQVLGGPDVMNGAPLSVGQTLKLLVQVGNPWSNNQVFLTVSPTLNGSSLTQVSTSQSNPSWEFDWTPDASEVGSHKVTFNASFAQNNGNVQNFAPFLTIVVKAAPTPATLSSITKLTLTSAIWTAPKKSSPTQSTLTIAGKVVVGGGKAPPKGTVVTLGDVSVANLKEVTSFKPNGSFTTKITLDPLTVPCAIQASVNAAPNALKTQKSLTGLTKGMLCIQ